MPDQGKKLKIVYLVARFHPFKGGAEQNCLQLAKRCAAEGHEVTVLTTNISPDGTLLPSEEEYLGIHIHRLRSWNKQINLGFYPALFPALMKINADIIHIENGPGILWHEFCLFWKRLFSRKKTTFIATPHGGFIATPETHTGLKQTIARLAKKIMGLYFKLLWPFLFDVIIAVNAKQIEWMTRDYWIPEKKITVLPNGIDASLIISKEDVVAKREALRDQPVVITAIGRMAKYKGFQYIIEALAKLKQENKLGQKFQLVVIGKPEGHHTELVKLIDKLGMTEVELLPSPSDEILRGILTKHSQINVLPSHFEATGIVLLDAMARGNAVISSDGNEAADLIVTNYENGFIFRSKDISDLADKLEILINDEDLRWKMIEHNLEKVKMFTWEEIFPIYMQLIHKSLKAK